MGKKPEGEKEKYEQSIAAEMQRRRALDRERNSGLPPVLYHYILKPNGRFALRRMRPATRQRLGI